MIGIIDGLGGDGMFGRDVRIPHYGPRPTTRRPPPRMYRIGDILLAYIAALLVNAAVAVAAPPLLILTYPAAGLVLSRYIGKRIVWWPFTANVEFISAVKLRLILAGPRLCRRSFGSCSSSSSFEQDDGNKNGSLPNVRDLRNECPKHRSRARSRTCSFRLSSGCLDTLSANPDRVI